MLLSAGLHVLPISAPVAGHTQTIYVTAVSEGEEFALVDAGFPGQGKLIIDALHNKGLDIERLSALILTHQDVDHIGSATALCDALPGKVVVYAHENEVPYITGRLRTLKLTDGAIENALRSLPPGLPDERRRALEHVLRNPPKVAVDVAISAERALPLPGNPQVVFTAGHTPGHVSLYFEQWSTLVAGDCLQADNGSLLLPDRNLCSDYAQAIESVRKLASYELRAVVCYHGGVVRGDIGMELRNLLDAVAD
ncbi:MAG TPA: MBL fold metallo-hydrolase [Spirochaetia bacterium]|nr:MBL fold metallo-hydrolase [Spirochaetia bacterium]